MNKTASNDKPTKARRYLSFVVPLLNGSDFDRSIKAIHYSLSVYRCHIATMSPRSREDFEDILGNTIVALNEILVAKKYIDTPICYKPGNEKAIQKQLEALIEHIHES